MRLIDIAVNLTDPMFRGVYNGSAKHADDLVHVLQRAARSGVERLIITGTSLQESRDSVALASNPPQLTNGTTATDTGSFPSPQLFATVGCHPTRCQEFDSDQRYLSELRRLIHEANQRRRIVIAVGECGLDYDRLQFCPKEVQQRYFEVQLELAKETGLPLFLHNRGTGGDFLATMRRLRSPAIQGVVHSYDGGVDEMLSLCNECGLYIGVNGCSMKTEENLEVVRQIPIDRLMIETDAPWCDIRPTHASSKWISASSRLTTAFPQQKKERFQPGQMVKGRNEPCQVRQILSIIANLRGVSEEQLAETVYQNTLRLFFPDEL